jgi:hypothetical protein
VNFGTICGVCGGWARNMYWHQRLGVVVCSPCRHDRTLTVIRILTWVDYGHMDSYNGRVVVHAREIEEKSYGWQKNRLLDELERLDMTLLRGYAEHMRILREVRYK